MRVHGHSPPPGAAVIVANHASWLDGIVLTATLPGPMRFVAGEVFTHQALAGLVLRRIGTVFVERWDRTPLQEQESIIGRIKASGAPHDGRVETDVPDYARDAGGKRTPLDAHIRLANPRTAQSQANLILRRPFNYSNGAASNGQLDMGLLFICYQADLARGFIAVQTRLNGEPLEEYLKPQGGGYFFVLPGVTGPDDFLGRSLLA